MIAICSLIFLSTPWLGQEPVPEQEPEKAASMEQIMEAIEKVRQDFADLDKSLLEARDLAENVAASDAEDPNEVQGKFEVAVNHADALLADMEELLAMLPAPSESSSPSQGGSSQSPSDPDHSKPPEQQSEQRPKPGEMDGNMDNQRSDGESDDASQLPPSSVQPIFLTPGQGGAWGHLPPRLQQTLQNAQAEDLPLRYRNLLEEFHRKNVDTL
ncbi:MAG: hypothetical protein HQ519_09875 [Planctomycetes bacterium]|nr:hypothetical protein [Planctomycetota bacterium]